MQQGIDDFGRVQKVDTVLPLSMGDRSVSAERRSYAQVRGVSGVRDEESIWWLHSHNSYRVHSNNLLGSESKLDRRAGGRCACDLSHDAADPGRPP